jgi:uncharacterized protein (TIGR01777 family)
MRLLISAASGLIGSAVAAGLAADQHEIVRLVRRSPGPGGGGEAGGREIRWDPGSGMLDPSAVEGFDAVVHLSGAPIIGRWTAAKKVAIRASRVDTTALLAGVLAKLARPPATLLVASAIGFYGDRGDESLTEESAPGTGWMAELCRAWEAAAEPAARRAIRVAHLRTGLVLAPTGGALAPMLLPFRLGLGGPVSSGRQYWSWVAIDDVVGAVRHLLAATDVRGPVNVTAPYPVTSREFARTLGSVLRRPAVLPVPAFALRLAFGESADAALLTGSRVLPAKLQASGFSFRYPHLEPALRHVLERHKGTNG